MDRHPAFNSFVNMRASLGAGWLRHWPRKLLALVLGAAGLTAALLHSQARPSSMPSPAMQTTAPVRPDLTAALSANQRAVPVQVLPTPARLIHPGDTVDLLAVPVSEAAPFSDSPDKFRARIIAQAVRVLAVDGDADNNDNNASNASNEAECSPPGSGASGLLHAETQGPDGNSLGIVVAATTDQVLNITSFASGAVLVSLHRRP